MEQCFFGCAYDIELKTCCIELADKFEANCYSYSRPVFSMHYLLRQKPYNVMWGGTEIVIKDKLGYFDSEEELYGLSTYLDHHEFEANNSYIKEKKYYDKVKFIEEHSKLWNKINLEDTPFNYFDGNHTHSVNYSGYLLNHTQKLAIDLADYYEKSKSESPDAIEMVIDPIPVLTETGGGTRMIFFKGITTDSTEELAGKWRSNLLEINDILPATYSVINCCFSEPKARGRYCYLNIGCDKNNFLLKNKNGELFECTIFSIFFEKHGISANIKVEKDGTRTRFIPVITEAHKAKTAPM